MSQNKLKIPTDRNNLEEIKKIKYQYAVNKKQEIWYLDKLWYEIYFHYNEIHVF